MTVLLGIASLFTSFASAQAEQTIVVDFTRAELRVVAPGGQTVSSTPVVLPLRDFYAVPLTGTVTGAMMGPSWTPTANTRAQYPGRYKARYAAYETGNAMGHCKITIDFDRSDAILNAVRIHGNAKSEDLNERHSRGCIRMPDAVCQTMIDLINDYDGLTRVQFTY